MDKKKIQQVEEVSKKVEEEAAQMDILDVLLDENNKEPIVLMDDKGKKLSFEQIAVIPYNNKIYCVLTKQSFSTLMKKKAENLF